jgi:4-hydroxy-3-methylbut-2-enyl diphosphate reductase IspH
VQTVEDLRVEWFENAEVVGVTAGTSTPDKSIKNVEDWLGELAAGKLQTQNSKLQGPMDDAVPAVRRD